MPPMTRWPELGWRAICFGLLAALPQALMADTPPISPAFVAAELVAIGHITGQLPRPGAGQGNGGCSGTLIAPTMVLTAAHCAAHRTDNPQNLYITFGWASDGPPLWRGTASAVRLYADYDGEVFEIDKLHQDVALVILPRPVPAELVPPIPLAAGLEAETYSSFGYLANADTLLRGQDGCQAVELTSAGVWGFDCDVVSGFSGGPLIAMTPDGPRVAAVAVAHAPGVRTGIRSFAVVPETRLFPDNRYPD